MLNNKLDSHHDIISLHLFLPNEKPSLILSSPKSILSTCNTFRTFKANIKILHALFVILFYLWLPNSTNRHFC